MSCCLRWTLRVLSLQKPFSACGRVKPSMFSNRPCWQMGIWWGKFQQKIWDIRGLRGSSFSFLSKASASFSGGTCPSPSCVSSENWGERRWQNFSTDPNRISVILEWNDDVYGMFTKYCFCFQLLENHFEIFKVFQDTREFLVEKTFIFQWHIGSSLTFWTWYRPCISLLEITR